MVTKGDKFLIKSFYDGMVQRGLEPFLATIVWNSWNFNSWFCSPLLLEL